MDKIFLIMAGEYSDRHCVGYCTTEEEAQKYCAVKNSTGSYEDHDYEEAECLNGAVNGHIDLGVSVDILLTSNGTVISVCDKICTRHKPIVQMKSSGRVSIRIWQKEYDRGRAVKVAQDSFYKWKAEKEEYDKAFVDRLVLYIEN